MKIYASKLSEDQLVKPIIESLLQECSFPVEIEKYAKVTVDLEVPAYNADNLWTHQLKGSFVEYTIGHLLKAENMDSEINECEAAKILSSRQLSQMRNYYNKLSKGKYSSKDALMVAMSHYFKNPMSQFNSQIFDFYSKECKNPVQFDNIDVLKEMVSVYSNFTVDACQSVSTEEIGGEIDFIASSPKGYFFGSEEIHIIESKYRTKNTDFCQLAVYAALLYLTKKIRATHLVIINPKNGQVKKCRLKMQFYTKAGKMINSIVDMYKNRKKTSSKATGAKIASPKVASPNKKKLRRTTSNKNIVRKPVKRIKESDMSWPTWIVYKIWG